MTREQKCKIAIEKGYTYDPVTGIVTGPKGKEIIRKTADGYVHFSMKYEHKSYNIRCHQFAWYWVNKETVDCLDHINQIKDDNRIINLRSVTKQQNNFNISIKGYYFDKNRNKWAASIAIDGKRFSLGRFEKEEDARAAYLEAKKKYHII